MADQRVPNGENLRLGCLYRIVEIDPSDLNPSLRVGDLIRCDASKSGCIDPENHESEGLNTQWFADYNESDGSFRTLVNGVEFVSEPAMSAPTI